MNLFHDGDQLVREGKRSSPQRTPVSALRDKLFRRVEERRGDPSNEVRKGTFLKWVDNASERP